MALGGPGIPRPSMQGEGHPSAALTWDKVRSIRQEYTAGNGTYQSLAEKYNMSPMAISNVVRNLNWHDPDYTPKLRRRGPR